MLSILSIQLAKLFLYGNLHGSFFIWIYDTKGYSAQVSITSVMQKLNILLLTDKSGQFWARHVEVAQVRVKWFHKTFSKYSSLLQNIMFSVTSSSQFLNHSVVLCLWKGGSVIIGVTHHHPQLHGLGDLSAIWTLNYNADVELRRKKRNTVFTFRILKK